MMEHFYENHSIKLKYYEIPNDLPPFVFLHAQGVDGRSFDAVAKKLSKRFHIYSVDCYGHGGSLHDPAAYNIETIGHAIMEFIQQVIGQPVTLLGHSSGGLIAAYIAANSDLCQCLVLEDPPFFASQGERRKKTFNDRDLSTVCHEYLALEEPGDFVLYYFANQYAWNLFPEKSREKTRQKLTKLAENDRKKHPDGDLKVPFWPKSALAGFQGMRRYDPHFGEAFYTDRFHCGIAHETLLEQIRCRTIFMKASTNMGSDGLLMAALNEADVKKAARLIRNCEIVRFDCGHGIHVEQPRAFVKCLLAL